MREAVIVAATRTAVGRAKKGTTRNARPDDMALAVIHELLRKTGDKLDPAQIDDVVIGCAMPEGSQGLNIARIISLMAGLPVSVPAQTINRFCSSGLQSIAIGAERIIANGADIILAGGVESMSDVPLTGFHLDLNLDLVNSYPEAYISMGLTAERVAEEFDISRTDQDEFAYNSHMKAAKALESGIFENEIVPIEFEEVYVNEFGHQIREDVIFVRDEHVRPTTTPEALAKLPPVFKRNGSVTAGNSSPLSDGAAGVILMEGAMAAQLGLTPLARFVGFNVGGVRPEIMGVGPVAAVPRVLERTGLLLDDMDIIELNEAFASQSVAVSRELEFDPEKVNVNGGAIALGHPLGCTGAKLTVQAINELRRRKSKYALVTMCIGGGMGAAGIFENLAI
ncbi:MAG: thiolase family protein [Chloroflexi bacterium]|nr:thiolase family protein [Chloroflexota bacterium]